METITIGIVGMGPRGVTVLERILEHAASLPSNTSVQVDVFDTGFCGQGVHRSEQPDDLLINTVASQVTMFAPDSIAGSGAELSLAQWAERSGYRRVQNRFEKNTSGGGETITDADHLPRPLLGEYLSWVFEEIVGKLPANVNVTHRRSRVNDLIESCEKFTIVCDDTRRFSADYVFLTTGHGTRKPTADDVSFRSFVDRHQAHNSNLAYYPSPYPVEGLASISSGATVAVQGFGLTAHDTISSLTIGRGGRYIEENGKLRYARSGHEPHMLLFSRNCLPFAARGTNQKGLTGCHIARFFTPAAVLARRAAVLRATGDHRIDFRTDVLPLIIKEMAYAYRCALIQGESPPDGFDPSEVELRAIEQILWPLNGRSFKSFEAFQQFFDDLLRDDLSEAIKGNLRSPVKAAADVLRDTREALRTAVEFGGLTPDSHRFFLEEFNAITNRVTFGPPKRRNQEYLALRDAGLIDIAGGPGARIVADDAHGRFKIEARYGERTVHNFADALVIARLDIYSPLTDSSELSANLLARGIIRPFRNGDYHPGGIDIDEDLHPVGASGLVQKNLWAIGYVIEGAHFYTHALPRPQIASRQTRDAERCVLQMFGRIGTAPAARRSGPQRTAPAGAVRREDPVVEAQQFNASSPATA